MQLMKQTVLLFFFCAALITLSYSQSVPKIQWQKCYGGSRDDELSLDYSYAGKPRGKIISRDKKHLFVAGSTASFDGDINSQISGSYDIWVAKLDLSGNIIWKTIISGYNYEEFRSLAETSDGSLLIIGSTYVWPQSGTHDALIAKLDYSGRLVWNKYFGGSADDYGVRIEEAKDGNYVFIGSSQSSDGDVAGYPGENEIWVAKIDKQGTVLWSEKYPGLNNSQVDFAVALKEGPHGDLFIGANSKDVSDRTGIWWNYDIIVLQLSSTGVEKWRKVLGGAENDILHDIELLASGDLLLAGSTSSTDRDFPPPVRGYTDGFLMKLKKGGDPFWYHRVGGYEMDEVFDVTVLPDQSFLAVGTTNSKDGNLDGNTVRGFDALVFNMTDDGQLRWIKTYGGSGNEVAASVGYFTERDFVFFGETTSNDFDVSGNHGRSDLWVVKIGSVNTIRGAVFYDMNFNGVKDQGEKWADGVAVTTSKFDYTQSTVTQGGFFTFEVDTGAYSTTVSRSYFSPLPLQKLSAFSDYLSSDSISFALQPVTNKRDLSVSLVYLTPARPGFDASYRLHYRNVGTSTVSAGEVLLKKDNRTSIVSASQAIIATNGDTLKWNFADLQPGDTASIIVNLKIAVPPAINNGDTLSFKAIINPVEGDETPHDDTAILRQIVVGSYDPNDKRESNAGSIPLSFVTEGRSLQYLIRFQNTGTDTAFNIVVRDTLSNRLNAGTLEMIAASHPHTLNIENGVNLAWTFSNILLPDSNRNEPASHGYIVYRIKPKSDLARGETIHNTASIYFDYNLPIVTNDAATTVQADLVTLPQHLLHFYGNLKSAGVNLNWKVAQGSAINRFEIERSADGKNYRQVGTCLAVWGLNDYSFTDPIAVLPGDAFFYRLKMLGENGTVQFSENLRFQRASGASGTLLVYPNPMQKQGWVVYTSTNSGKATLQVLTAAGTVIISQPVVLQKGKNLYSLPSPASLPPGIYTVQVINGKEISSRFFVIQ